MFWAPWQLTPKHVHLLSVVFFQFHIEERWDVDVQITGEKLNANDDK